MDYEEMDNPLHTKAAIQAINDMRDDSNRINCLVFFSAVKDASNLPQINPKNAQIDKIVAVGLDNADLNVVLPSNGIAVSVPKHFLDSHVNQIVSAIMKKPAPVTTTPKPTTAPPQITPECLVVGDLYNFGKDQDAYDLEADLLDAVGYDVFGVSPGSKLGLWLYGYTKRTSPSSALQKMRSNYTQFKNDLDDMEYIETNDPVTTRSAIQSINELRDNNNRINCLVFLSAAKNAYDLPRINPQHLQLKRIVAVGLDST
ncbi:hypothetical protein ANCCAN_01923 [Ancylostoma caninum]|uniref:VWFA domain-containing protein n=1 Tax=Ancylostoma caninum TaxID=29170 RepID=A0A368H9A7_ANCCA|nr:hypothetical protein ANCCAN_01923 [Ancylostoma caninum]